MSDATTLRERIAQFRQEVDDESVACGRLAGSVAIVGVSKRQSAEDVVEAVEAGLRNIGENYVQEAGEKLPQLRARLAGTPFQAHFVGHVQTNKAKRIIELFDVVQTVDRPDAARALGKAAEAVGRQLKVLLQVNISPSERLGCPPGDVGYLAEIIHGNAGLSLEGMMAIGPITDDRNEIVRSFALAAKTFALMGGSTLSIGMSGDWREAVRAGSTMIRIGTALFGERRYA